MINPLYEENQGLFTEPCVVVIFGASGDLTSRKLMPALYHLLQDGQLPSQFACVGFARRAKTDLQFREEAKASAQAFSRTPPLDDSLWNHFQDHLFYHQSEFHDDAGYASLKQKLQELDNRFGTKGNRIFYLATPPSYFPLICEKLKNNHLLDSNSDSWSRIIIEKPFGHDLTSAEKLQQELLRYLTEDQIYRIDHYLGKETVQNLLVFRFANSLFEPLWNNHAIDHVQIAVAEEIGIGTRGKFFEETGLLRDIIQNHVMQLISLVAMEPPTSLDAKSIRDEKVKLLKAISPLAKEHVVRGQYSPGLIYGEAVSGYREEKDVAPTSSVETYTALKLFIDNPRWRGTPFYIRAGKRLPKRVTEIAITFKKPSNTLFEQGRRQNDPNVLVIRIQPDEGIALKTNCKVPGPMSTIQPVKMDFKYASYFGRAAPEAYERLIYDAILGDTTLFARQDEVMLSWNLLSPVLQWWKETPSDCPSYPAGSWGPEAANKLLEADGRKWRLM